MLQKRLEKRQVSGLLWGGQTDLAVSRVPSPRRGLTLQEHYPFEPEQRRLRIFEEQLMSKLQPALWRRCSIACF